MVPEFWIWAKWKDLGGKGALPPQVRDYYLAHHIDKAPAAWKARYALHKGASAIVPQPPTRAKFWDYVVFTAQAPETAMRFSPKWTVALSADQAFEGQISDALVAALRRGGRAVVSWSDSHATPSKAAKDLMQQFHLDGWIGQAEQVSELVDALSQGATHIVGNANEIADKSFDLHQALIKRTMSGEVQFVQECYWGDGSQAPSATSARGVNASSLCLGVYPAATNLIAYYVDMPSLRNSPHWIYYSEGCSDDDVRLAG